MTQVAIEELLQRCGSVYRLIILAAKRAKEVADGAPPLVASSHKKVTSIALDEILHGKVLYKVDEREASVGKRGRSVKAKEEKKKGATR